MNRHWDAIYSEYEGETYADRVVDYLTEVVRPDIIIARDVAYIRSGSAEAKIHYTLDGSAPTEESPIYTLPVSLPANGVIQARGFDEGKTPSEIASKAFGETTIEDVDLNLTISEEGSSNVFTFSYTRAKDLEEGTSYTIEQSPDMTNWTPVDPSTLTTSDIDSETMEVHMNGEMSEFDPALFLRVRIEKE